MNAERLPSRDGSLSLLAFPFPYSLPIPLPHPPSHSCVGTLFQIRPHFRSKLYALL